MQAIVFDTNIEYLKDFSVKQAIDGVDTVNPIKTISEINVLKNLSKKWAMNNIDYSIIVSNDALEFLSQCNLQGNPKLLGFSKKKLSNNNQFIEKGIAYLGVFNTASDLFDIIGDENFDFEISNTSIKEENTTFEEIKNNNEQKSSDNIPSITTNPIIEDNTPIKDIKTQLTPEDLIRKLDEWKTIYENMLEKPKKNENLSNETINTTKKEIDTNQSIFSERSETNNIGFKQDFNQISKEDFDSTAPMDIISAKREAEANKYNDKFIDNDLKSSFTRNCRTKVVTVFSSKGGVGKTTMSTQLASALATTSNSRRPLNVCIVDMNIDYGDVCNSLGYNLKGTSMAHWAQDINIKIAQGEKPECMQYSRDDISRYLQLSSDTGLYALIAPTSYSDSTLINTSAISVMITNLIKNGGFDYIVFDTGNNTRDCTIMALKAADYIFNVITQDINTIYDNISVIKSFPSLNIDTSKVRAIINKTLSQKETNFSVESVEESIPYPCVARIRQTSDIVRAMNNCTPLCTHKNSKFNQQLFPAISYLLNGDIIKEQKSWFSKIFKK